MAVIVKAAGSTSSSATAHTTTSGSTTFPIDFSKSGLERLGMIRQPHLVDVFNGPLGVVVSFKMNESNTATSSSARINQYFRFSDFHTH